jgi:hypothetical protein
MPPRIIPSAKIARGGTASPSTSAPSASATTGFTYESLAASVGRTVLRRN